MNRKRIIRSILTAAVAVLLVSCFPQATRLPLATATPPVYVSANGSDSNSGTIDAPYKTFSKGFSVADVVIVRGGTYPGYILPRSGVSLLAYTGESPIISGGAGLKCSNLSGVTVSGFIVTGATNTGNGAIYFNRCNNSVISNNVVKDNITSGESGIYVSGSNNKVLHNDVYRNNLDGIRLSGASGASTGNEIAFNRAHDNTLSAGNSDGIGCADANVSLSWIHDNEVYGNSDDGIDTWTSHDNTVQGNTAHNNGGTGDGNGFKMGGNVTGGNNRVLFNISYSNFASGFTSNGGGNYYEGNQAYGNAGYGFVDSYRASGNTMTSQFVNNYAWNNSPDNFHVSGSWITLYTGNVQLPPAGTPPTATRTSTVTALPPTATPSPTKPPLSPTVTNTKITTSTPTIIPTTTAQCVSALTVWVCDKRP